MTEIELLKNDKDEKLGKKHPRISALFFTIFVLLVGGEWFGIFIPYLRVLKHINA